MICRRSRLMREPPPCARSVGAFARSATPIAIVGTLVARRLWRRADHRAGIVRFEDRAKILAGARTADGAPLTHPHTMPIAHPVERETRERAVGSRRRCDGKIGALENLATVFVKHESNVVAAQGEVAAGGGDGDRAVSSGLCVR